MTRIAIVGDVHGHWNLVYDKLGKDNIELILQLGDTGIFSSLDTAKRINRHHETPLDFFPYLYVDKQIPIQTLFIRGNHEDFDFLDQYKGEIPNLEYLAQGSVISIDCIRFGVLGGNYSPKYFTSTKLPSSRRKHFTIHEINSLKEQDFDILLSHEGPYSNDQVNGIPVITELVQEKQPVYNFHGHLHFYYKTIIGNTEVIGLAGVDSHMESIYVFDTEKF